MSRHDVPLKAGSGMSKAQVGWDRPLATFYVQIYETRGDEDVPVIWLGTDYAELPKAADAIALLKPHCDIPYGLSASLEIDRMGTLASPDGPAQKSGHDFIRRMRGKPPLH